MQGAERRKGKGPSRHVPEEDTMGTINDLSERVNEAMTTAYRAELARRPQTIQAAKRVYPDRELVPRHPGGVAG